MMERNMLAFFPSMRILLVVLAVIGMVLHAAMVTHAEEEQLMADTATDQSHAPEPTPPPVIPTVMPEPATTPIPTVAAPEPSPTSVPPTPEPTPMAVPATVASESTAEPLLNRDSMTALAPNAAVTLRPGDQHGVAFTYLVTTERAGTIISADLRTADGGPAPGWMIQGQAGQHVGNGSGAQIELRETGTPTPGATFTLTFTIQAAADVTDEQIVTLYVRSTVVADNGSVEAGVMAPAIVTLR
jgi:hypothetical protein